MGSYLYEILGPSANRTSPRVKPISGLLIHHWGDPARYRSAGAHDGVVTYLLTKRETHPSSANAVISGWPLKRVSEIVPHTDIAWQAGVWSVSEVTVGYELQPFDDLTPRWQVQATFETACAYFAVVWHRVPALRNQSFRGHRDVKATSCPGNWYPYLDRFFDYTATLYNYVDPNRPGEFLTPPPPVPKEWFMEQPMVGRLTSPYGMRNGTMHAGIDIAPPVPGTVGSPVYAAFAGTGIATCTTQKPGDKTSGITTGRTGNGVIIGNIGPGSSNDGEGQCYNHVFPAIKVGQVVRAGDLIGHTDLSGNQSGPHLHYEEWRDYRNPSSHRDPMLSFNQAGLTPGVGGGAQAVSGRTFLPLVVDGLWGHRSITEAERALARAGFYKGEIEEDLGKTAIDGPMFWAAYNAFLVANGFEGNSSGEQAWIHSVDPAFYPWMPPDGKRGSGTISGLQQVLNAGKMIVAVPKPVEPPVVVVPPVPSLPPVIIPPTQPAPGTPIMATLEMGTWNTLFAQLSGLVDVTPLFLNEMVPGLYWAAVRYGIDPYVLVGQAAHETGWGRFGRAATPEHHNTCGLKVRNPVGPDTNPDDHARFSTWREGATAHAQHLYAYMTMPLPAGEANIDPRWDWVYPKNYNLTVVEELSTRWAPSTTYGQTVAALVQRLRELPVLPGVVVPPNPVVAEPEPEPPTPTEPAPLPGPGAEITPEVIEAISQQTADAVVARIAAHWAKLS